MAKPNRVKDIPEVFSAQIEEDAPEIVVSAVPVKAATKTNMCRVSLFVTLDPAPTIGTYSFAAEQSLSLLKAGVHTMPRHVAEVLVDKQLAAFV